MLVTACLVFTGVAASSLVHVTAIVGQASSGLNPTQIENQNAGSADYQDRTGIANSTAGLTSLDGPQPDARVALAPTPPPTGFVVYSTPDLRGYAAQESVNRGQRVGLHISSKFPRFDIAVFRNGWYGGAGARVVFETTVTNGALRSVPTPDANGMVDAAWPQTLSLDTTTFPSGAYLVSLSQEGSPTALGLIPFIVREDRRVADVLFELPTQTWQAYDNFGGKSTYDINSTNQQRAYKVSLNRPYEDGGGAGQFASVYNLIRFLEREGYDITYAASSDIDRDANIMNNRKVLVSGFHDEYWTGQMFTNLKRWISQGKHFLSLSSNSIYWQTRYENNRRTLVVYKDAALDPVTDPKQKTVLFRSKEVDRPESELLSAMYEGSYNYPEARDWVVKNSGHWIYAGTGLAEGAKIKDLVGYEWDRVFDVFLRDLFNPRLDLTGTTLIADSPIYPSSINTTDQDRHQAVVRELSSGAIVVNVGTNYWPLMLTNNKPFLINVDPATVAAIERITNNALRRMISTTGVPPTTSTTTSTTTTTTTTTTTSTTTTTTTTTTVPSTTTTTIPSTTVPPTTVPPTTVPPTGDDIPVYIDGLGAGFEDWSWTARDLVSGGPAIGSRALAFEPDDWLGLKLHTNAVSQQVSSLRFSMNGGLTGGQKIRVSVLSGSRVVATSFVSALGSPIPKGAFAQYELALPGGVPAGAPLDLVWQDWTGTNQSTTALDEVRLSTNPATTAGSLVLYDDQFVSASNWSWAPANIASSSPVQRGTRAIAAPAVRWSAVRFHLDAPFVPPTGAKLELWVHGGAQGGQLLEVHFARTGAATVVLKIPSITGAPIPANAWQRVQVDLAAAGLADSSIEDVLVYHAASFEAGDYSIDEVRFTW